MIKIAPIIAASVPVEERKRQAAEIIAGFASAQDLGRSMMRFKTIIEEVSYAFEVSQADILGCNRQPYIVRARFAAIRLARDTGASLPRIGHFFHRDHSSIFNAIRRADEFAAQDPEYRQIINNLRNEVQP